MANRYNNLMEKSNNLSKNIGKNVIVNIEKGKYKTTCDECS